MNFLRNVLDSINSLFNRVPLQEQVAFARHLAVMTKAGLPLLESLRMLQKETRSKSLKKILDRAISDVSNGQFLSASLEKYKNVFGDLFINIIRVGESAGILAENLGYLADELKKKQELKRKVVGAMIYPAVIVVATFGITGLLTVFIFPKILPVFKTLRIELPATTKILITISNVLTEQGPLVLLIAVGAIIALWLVMKIKVVRHFVNLAMLRLPVFGKIIKDVNLANFSRTLGLTLKSGVRVVEAINITAESLKNPVYRREFFKVAEAVRKGEALAPFFAKKRFLFPGILTQMVSVGEAAGNLSETLLYLADFHESEVNEVTKNLSNVLEPILMVLMGVVVGFVAISIITPIYEVTQNIGQPR